MSDTNSNAPEQVTDSAGIDEGRMETVGLTRMETVGLAQVTAGEGLEVKPVAPIVMDTPDQIIARLRKELEDERAKVLGLSDFIEHLKLDRDLAKKERESALVARDSLAKRVGEMAGWRDSWQRRAETAEKAVDAQKAERLVAMIDERQKLRTDCGHKDKQIADLTSKLDAAQTQVAAARQVASQSQQRFAGLEATAQTMQAARDKAQQERGGALEDLATARKTISDMHTAAAGEKRAADASPLRDVKALREDRDRLKTQVDTLLANLKAEAATKVRKGA